MKIRPAKLADSAELARIQVDSYRKNYAGILPEEFLEQFSLTEQEQDWRDWFKTESGESLFVALDEQAKLAGYALMKPNRLDLPPYEGELVSLHVRSDRQGLGYGHHLMIAASRALRESGCKSLFLWVLADNPARSFYEGLGGKLVGEKPWGGNLEFRIAILEVAYGWADIRKLSDPVRER